MITKTIVTAAILANEKNAGWSELDTTPTYISRGDLFTLIEAAKCAHYENSNPWSQTPKSNSEAVLKEPATAEILADDE